MLSWSGVEYLSEDEGRKSRVRGGSLLCAAGPLLALPCPQPAEVSWKSSPSLGDVLCSAGICACYLISLIAGLSEELPGNPKVKQGAAQHSAPSCAVLSFPPVVGVRLRACTGAPRGTGIGMCWFGVPWSSSKGVCVEGTSRDCVPKPTFCGLVKSV